MAAKLSEISSLFHTRKLAVLHQPGAMRDADQRPGIVEHIHKKDREHYDQECEFTDARKIELQKCRRQRRWH
jgi:hypothetical protein